MLSLAALSQQQATTDNSNQNIQLCNKVIRCLHYIFLYQKTDDSFFVYTEPCWWCTVPLVKQAPLAHSVCRSFEFSDSNIRWVGCSMYQKMQEIKCLQSPIVVKLWRCDDMESRSADNCNSLPTVTATTLNFVFKCLPKSSLFSVDLSMASWSNLQRFLKSDINQTNSLSETQIIAWKSMPETSE